MTTMNTEPTRLANDYWTLLLGRDPLLQAKLGMQVESLRGVSQDEVEAGAQYARGVVEQVGARDSEDDTLAFLVELAQQDTRSAAHYWLTPTATPYSLLWLTQYGTDVFQPFRFTTDSDADRYLSLVHDLAIAVRSVKEKVRGQAARGIRIPRPALAGARATVAGLRSSLSSAVAVSTDQLTPLGPAATGRLRDGVVRLLAAEVGPAFDVLLATLDDPDYVTAASDEVGWARYEDGEGAYRAFVRQHTTSEVAPEELHELGRQQCAELAERMRAVRAALGFKGTEAEFHARLQREPRLYAHTPDDIEARYRAYLDLLQPQLPQWFSTLPRAPYGVERMEPEWEPSLTFGFYEPPTADRPLGRYRYNGSNLGERSLLTAATLIYHELAPGHHFQIARQTENETLPRLRRESVAFTGFVEGWAEYAAGLGWEMGLYTDPWEAYGRLAHERFTAQRLVVDTGLNLGTMTLDQAHAFMRANTTESEAQITCEVMRYATDMPGQALAYRAGFIEFVSLRAAADDVVAFHEAVLSGGALPFPALRRRLARELASASGPTADAG